MKPRDPAKMRLAIEKIDEMLVLEAKKLDLLRELKRCLLVIELVPDLDHKDVASTSVHDSASSMWNPIKDMTLVVHLKDGGSRKFPLVDVDPALWPEGVKAPKNR